LDTQVLIVGAGPVGLTLALDLGQRGIRCTLIERKDQPAFLPKMERVNARSMEIYRRMGLAKKIRAAGLRLDIPMDVFIVLDLTRPPLLRLPYPSVAESEAEIRGTYDGTLPLEPYQLISQYTLEPLLAAEAEKLTPVTMRWSTEYLSHEQDAQGVRTTVRLPDGNTEVISADYLVGCDGGTSAVRQALNIKLRGEANLLGLRQALYRCDELFDKIPIGNGPGHGRHYHVANKEGAFLLMQDSTKHWSLHGVVENDDEMNRLFERVVGIPVKYELLSCNPWRQNLLVADRYQDGRVFLAGDAVHLVILVSATPSISAGSLPPRCRAGAGRNCWSRMSSSGAKSATATSAPRATPTSAAANGARCGSPTFSTIRRRASAPATRWR
jgi:2-polyprenyl-6-methoxyphenol hydroxylase-like FAD-dependent oxidoreductase